MGEQPRNGKGCSVRRMGPAEVGIGEERCSLGRRVVRFRMEYRARAEGA